MQENWVKIEYTFRNSGIYFELKGGLYLCLIEGRYFYYSPNTGKWRMKGKRPWFVSTSTEDFMASAKVYDPPDYQSSSSRSQSHQKKTQKKSSTKKKRKKQTKQAQHSTYSYYSSGSNHHQERGEDEDIRGIRPQFLSVFEHYLQQQRKRGYKIGWIWYQLIEEITPSTLEICWLSVVFQYSPYWAVYKNLELYGRGDQTTILLLIKTHQREWLNYFQKRWGVFEEQKQKQQHKQYKQQKTSSSRQYQSTASSFAHQAYLQVLGLTFPFTHQELKKAYRQRALETHPDSGGTAEAFRQIHHAYQTLRITL